MTSHKRNGPIGTVTVQLEADADGWFPAVAFPAVEGDMAHLLSLRTTPGEPGPSDGFNVRLRYPGGYDALEGSGKGRSGKRPRVNLVQYADVAIHPYLSRSPLTLTVTGNVVPLARLEIQIRYGSGAELDHLNLLGG